MHFGQHAANAPNVDTAVIRVADNNFRSSEVEERNKGRQIRRWKDGMKEGWKGRKERKREGRRGGKMEGGRGGKMEGGGEVKEKEQKIWNKSLKHI